MKKTLLTLLGFTHVAYAGIGPQPYRSPVEYNHWERTHKGINYSGYNDEYGNSVVFEGDTPIGYLSYSAQRAIRPYWFSGIMKTLLPADTYSNIQNGLNDRKLTFKSDDQLNFEDQTFYAINFGSGFYGSAIRLPENGLNLKSFFPKPNDSSWHQAIEFSPYFYTRQRPSFRYSYRRGVREFDSAQGKIAMARRWRGDNVIHWAVQALKEINKDNYYIDKNIIYHYDTNTAWQYDLAGGLTPKSTGFPYTVDVEIISLEIRNGPFDVIGNPSKSLPSTLIGQLLLPKSLLENTYTGSTVSLGADFDQEGSGGKIVVDQSN